MHWRISSNARNGLKIIEEIPDYRLCLIEGPNGVGKSVAVQLLELISGKVPASLSAPPVWYSFKENLGNTVVEIGNMAGNGSARIRFTPEAWPSEPPTSVTDSFGEVTIDGQEATMSQMSALLDVTTVRGDESLQDTVRGHIEQIENHLHQTTETVRNRANETDEFVAQFSSDWLRADPAAVGRYTAKVRELKKDLQGAQDRLQEAEKTAEELDRAMEIVREVTSAGSDVQALLQQQADIKKKVAEYNEKITDLEEQSDAAEKALAAQGGTAAELSTAEKTLRTRQTRLSKQQRELAELTARIGLPADLEIVRAELKTCNTEQKRLTAEINAIDKGRRTQDALQRLIPVLDGTSIAESDDVLMVIREDRYTGRQVRDGFAARSTEIAESPRPEKALETNADMDKVKRRIAALTRYRTAITDLDRTGVLLAEADAEHKLAQKKSAGATKAAADLREIHEALAAVESHLNTAHQESVELQERIGLSGVSSAKEAKAALSALLTVLGVDEAELDTAQATAARKLHEAADDVKDRTKAIAVAEREANDAHTHISTLLSEVATSPTYEWLRAALSADHLDALPHDDMVIFTRVRQVILDAAEAVFAAGRQLDRLARLAHVLAEAKPSKSDAAQLEQPIGPPLARALGDSLRRALNTESIRNRVFGGLEVERLDLQGQVIVLAGPDGHSERRAMSAFSTGERAFAFTQARILDLQPSAKPNRLLVLDEFGAFISADRMADLREFLDTLDALADQIVIILPLQVNYKDELKDTRGQLREKYEDRIRQLETRNYSAAAL